MYHTEITEFIVAKHLKIEFDCAFLGKNYFTFPHLFRDDW